MRKRITGSPSFGSDAAPKSDPWLDLEQIATVEVTSEDAHFPVEAALQLNDTSGWRAGEDGEQLLRIIFDKPTALHRMELQFVENEVERTQEFTIRWSAAQGGPSREFVRQQWTFSPRGSTREIEHWELNLSGVGALELAIKPDLNAGQGRATLLKWRVG